MRMLILLFPFYHFKEHISTTAPKIPRGIGQWEMLLKDLNIAESYLGMLLPLIPAPSPPLLLSFR